MSSIPQIAAAETTPHQDVLNRAIDFGDRLMRLAVEQAEAATLPVEKAAAAYDRVTRSIRKSIWLVRKLAEPATNRIAARKQIIRQVEDSIQRETDHPEDAECLHEELMDRLDTLDFENDIAARPISDVIADIIHDLGLGAVPGIHPWKRRTPGDLARLHACAAQRAMRPHTHRPPPVGWNSS